MLSVAINPVSERADSFNEVEELWDAGAASGAGGSSAGTSAADWFEENASESAASTAAGVSDGTSDGAARLRHAAQAGVAGVAADAPEERGEAP